MRKRFLHEIFISDCNSPEIFTYVVNLKINRQIRLLDI